MVARLRVVRDEERTPTRPAVRSGGCVLLVEDDDDLRALAAAVLRSDGWAVDEVATGIEMLRRLETTVWAETPLHYDVIVADVLLPDLTAFDVLDALRSRDLTTPVILMTAHGGDEVRGDARSLGAFALLDKPLDWDALRDTIRQAVGAGLR
jgi:CheY-like chemotaxis protein